MSGHHRICHGHAIMVLPPVSSAFAAARIPSKQDFSRQASVRSLGCLSRQPEACMCGRRLMARAQAWGCALKSSRRNSTVDQGEYSIAPTERFLISFQRVFWSQAPSWCISGQPLQGVQWWCRVRIGGGTSHLGAARAPLPARVPGLCVHALSARHRRSARQVSKSCLPLHFSIGALPVPTSCEAYQGAEAGYRVLGTGCLPLRFLYVRTSDPSSGISAHACTMPAREAFPSPLQAESEVLDATVCNLNVCGLQQGHVLSRDAERVSLTVRRVERVMQNLLRL